MCGFVLCMGSIIQHEALGQATPDFRSQRALNSVVHFVISEQSHSRLLKASMVSCPGHFWQEDFMSGVSESIPSVAGVWNCAGRAAADWWHEGCVETIERCRLTQRIVL